MIWVYFGYAVTIFRQEGAAIVDGPPITGNARIQATWLIVTSALVLGLAVFGTDRPAQHGRRRRRRGPRPRSPSPPTRRSALQVQVIGQQWLVDLPLSRATAASRPRSAGAPGRPRDRVPRHLARRRPRFWAIELASRPTRFPGADNVAFVKPLQHRHLPGPLRGALRALARPHEHHRRCRQRRARSRPGSRTRSARPTPP